MKPIPVQLGDGQLGIALVKNLRVAGVYQVVVHPGNESARLEKATPRQCEEALRDIARSGKSNNQP